MKYPIRWGTVGVVNRPDYRAIRAELDHDGNRYALMNALPQDATPQMIELVIRMMQIEILGAVKNPPAV